MVLLDLRSFTPSRLVLGVRRRRRRRPPSSWSSSNAKILRQTPFQHALHLLTCARIYVYIFFKFNSMSRIHVIYIYIFAM